MPIGTIELNGLFYKLSGEDKTEFIMNEVLKKTLPNDIVEYTKYKNKIVIDKILYRNPIETLGVIKNNYIKLPLISNSFLDITSFRVDSLKFYLVKISLNHIDFVKEFSNPIDACICLYGSRDNFEKFSKDISGIFSDSYLTERNNIIDQTHLNTMTIDPSDSKDFDDAISVDILNNTIYIHIVDICYYLRNKKSEESLAFYYGNTLYTPHNNYNIFKDSYAEFDFSLIKNESRNVITTEIKLRPDKSIKEYNIYPSLIKVKNRYNYSSTNIDNNVLEYLKSLLDNKDWIYSKIIIPNRKLIIKDDCIKEVIVKYPNSLNKIIETLMIMNNILVTQGSLEAISRGSLDVPQRFHKKAHNSFSVLENSETNYDNYTIIDFINLLKSYKAAKYSIHSSGHFGLNLDKYTHFTSPIRRSFDIIIHKILNNYLINDIESLEFLVNHLNYREKLSDKITHYYEKYYILKYLKESKKSYNAIVIQVLRNGFRFLIEDLVYDDYVPFSENRAIEKDQRIFINSFDIDLFELRIRNIVYI
jgi:ribonuclease R